MAITRLSCDYYRFELQKRRLDWASLKHTEDRYAGVVNEAIRAAPRSLWLMDVDISLIALEDTRTYALAAITALTGPHDLRRVEIEDANGFFSPVGRWWVEDHATVLTLNLDETPTVDMVIRLHFVTPFAELDCAAPAAVTALDEDWLIAKAMTLLLMEADPQVEDPKLTVQDLQVWDAKRQAREAQEGRRWLPEKVRTRRWLA